LAIPSRNQRRSDKRLTCRSGTSVTCPQYTRRDAISPRVAHHEQHFSTMKRACGSKLSTAPGMARTYVGRHAESRRMGDGTGSENQEIDCVVRASIREH